MSSVSTTIRISDDTHKRIADLARRTERSMTAVLDDAVDALERRAFFAAFNEGWARIRADEEAWAEVEVERAEWDVALQDGQA